MKNFVMAKIQSKLLLQTILMRFILILLLSGFSFLGNAQKLHELVNPFIGTGGHGHTFPGATAPFGMVQLSPDSRLDGWDGCSGYHYSDSVIYGFSHTHLSGTGCSDYGDVMLMPVMGNFKDKNEVFKPTVYSSKFKHETEKAHAGFYGVKLEDDQILCRMTATERTGFHEYQFLNKGKAYLVLDLLHRDELLESRINIVNKRTIEGFRRSKAWATDQWVYFRIEFSKNCIEQIEYTGKKGFKQTGIAFGFKMKKNEKLLVKVSLSAVNEAGAANNMSKEIPHWNFNQALTETENKWDKELGLIKVEGNTKDKQIIFYTALYHTFIQPNIASDVDGKYRGRDNLIHEAKGFDYYSVFSLWDTFRAAHPLYNLVQRKRSNDFIQTFIRQYKEGGRLPVWELWSNETDCMIGYHSVSVIADAWAKGIRNFNKKDAIEAMLHSANRDEHGLKSYKKNGFISIEDDAESVSKTLEYAYDDWCISTFLEGVQKEVFEKRAQSWKNIFDPKSGFMRPRSNGGFLEPFEPREVNNHFTEANSWQYSFFVPHDINGLMQAHGGAKNFEKKLDALFSENSKTTGREQADITGLIGQYAHGNEPSHHMAWLYNFTGNTNKTQGMIRRILESQYQNAPDGLSGNEDCGQMSAWFIMSSIGLYSVCPGTTSYETAAPYFDKIVVQTGLSKSFSILANDAAQNSFVVYRSINGNTNPGFKLEHEQLMENQIISYKLSKSELSFPIKENILPELKGLFPAPLIQTKKQAFKDSMLVSLGSLESPSLLYYSLNGSDKLIQYKAPFYIYKTTDIKCLATDLSGNRKNESNAHFHLIPHNWSIMLKSKITKPYTGGGDDALIDGLRGDENWRKGLWQGYWGQDFEAIIDLQKMKKVKTVKASFLQDSKSWILFPKNMEVSYSVDGENYMPFNTADFEVKPENETVSLLTLRTHQAKGVDAMFIKVKAKHYGKLPENHLGAGYPAYIFIDEIDILEDIEVAR